MQKKFNLTISRTGIPCLWECGGAMTKTGFAWVIANNAGKPKHAIHVRNHGQLACDLHALIPIKRGDYKIFAEHGHGKDYIKVYCINEINLDEEFVICEEMTEIPRCLMDAIDACVVKSFDYHCRSPHYIIQSSNKNKMDSIDTGWDDEYEELLDEE